MGVPQCRRNDPHRARDGCRPRHPVETDVDLQPLAVAKLLKAIADQEQPRLIILGKQAIDDDMSATGPMLARCSVGRRARSPASWRVDGDVITVTREVDGGPGDGGAEPALHRHHGSAAERTPLRLLPNIMKARKKPIDNKKPADLGVDPTTAVDRGPCR